MNLDSHKDIIRTITCFIAVTMGSASCATTPETESPAAEPLSLQKTAAKPQAFVRQVVGPAPRIEQAERVVGASQIFQENGATYLKIPYERVTGSREAPPRVYLRDGVRGFSILNEESNAVLVRLSVSEPLPKTLRLRVFSHGKALAKENLNALSKTPVPSLFVQNLWVKKLTSAKKDPGLPKVWARSAARFFINPRDRSAGSSFGAFAAARISTSMNVKPPWQSRFRRFRKAKAMNLMTGLTAVDEALQFKRGLRVRASTKASEPITLSSISGVTLRDHPWKKMLEALPGSPQPKVESMAYMVPNDFLYIHVNDPRALVQLGREIDDFVSPIIRASNDQFGAQHLVKRYEKQLMVERLGLATKIGHLAADSVALLTSSPYFGDGTDLTLIFRQKNKILLNTALAVYEQRAKSRSPDLTIKEIKIAGHTVRQATTADGHINQLRSQFGDYLILSNSPGALRKIFAVMDRNKSSLGQSAEYQYFRAIHQFDPHTESAYVFISDAFVRNVVGPRQKVLQARRMVARSELQGLGYAALLHGWLEGQTPSDGEFRQSMWASAADFIHSDGGHIQFDAQAAAHSDHGSLVALKPLIDVSIDTITTQEKAAYESFVRTYEQNWDEFLDPIGVRIKRSKQGLEIETRMMPLIKQSAYGRLLRMVGEVRLDFGTAKDGVRFVGGISKDASIRGHFERLARLFLGQSKAVSWLGNWFIMGAKDTVGLWNLALRSGQIPSQSGRRSSRRSSLWNQTKRINQLPAYFAVQVTDTKALQTFLGAIKEHITLLNFTQDEPYGDTHVTRVSEKVSAASKRVPLRCFYAVVNQVFLVSLTRETLESQIDWALKGKKPSVSERRDGLQASRLLSPKPKNSFLSKTILGLLEKSSSKSNAQAALAFEAVARGLPGMAMDRQITLNYLGRSPNSVHGGKFSLGKDQMVTHSLYGQLVNPKVLEVPVSNSPLAAVSKRLRDLELAIGFETKGVSSALVTRVMWRKKKK